MKTYYNNLVAEDASYTSALGWYMSPHTDTINNAKTSLIAHKKLIADCLAALITAHGTFKAALCKPGEEPLGDIKELLDHVDILLAFANRCMERCTVS